MYSDLGDLALNFHGFVPICCFPFLGQRFHSIIQNSSLFKRLQPLLLKNRTAYITTIFNIFLIPTVSFYFISLNKSWSQITHMSCNKLRLLVYIHLPGFFIASFKKTFSLLGILELFNLPHHGLTGPEREKVYISARASEIWMTWYGEAIFKK